VRSTAFEAADPSGGSGSVEVKKFLFSFRVFHAVMSDLPYSPVPTSLQSE
jgi:hypothetical protein